MPSQGYLTSLFGNVLLLGCFVDKQEGGATAVQAIGATANFIMLGQAGADLHQQVSSNADTWPVEVTNSRSIVTCRYGWLS